LKRNSRGDPHQHQRGRLVPGFLIFFRRARCSMPLGFLCFIPQDYVTIAHRFYRWGPSSRINQSREGRQNCFLHFVSPLWGSVSFHNVYPPINRWVIFESPAGQKSWEPLNPSAIGQDARLHGRQDVCRCDA